MEGIGPVQVVPEPPESLPKNSVIELLSVSFATRSRNVLML